jgi:hypothetical protein
LSQHVIEAKYKFDRLNALQPENTMLLVAAVASTRSPHEILKYMKWISDEDQISPLQADAMKKLRFYDAQHIMHMNCHVWNSC